MGRLEVGGMRRLRWPCSPSCDGPIGRLSAVDYLILLPMSWAAFALPSGATSGLAEQLCAKPLRDRPEEDTRACSRAEVQALAAGQDGAVDKALGLAAAPAPRAEALPLWAPLLGELPVPPCFVRKPKGVMDLGQAEPRQQARHGLQAALEAGGALPPIQPVVVLCLTPPDSPRQVVLQTRISVWLNSVRGKPLPLPERQRRANELAAFDARLVSWVAPLWGRSSSCPAVRCRFPWLP